nr:uncharacterized protein LOC128685941 [Cherax quadricarinatus]
MSMATSKMYCSSVAQVKQTIVQNLDGNFVNFLVYDWRVEELQLLTETIITWELQPHKLLSVGKTMPNLASSVLKINGFKRTPLQCQDQWHYIVAAFRHGGYKQLAEQINLIYLLMPSTLNPNLFYLYPSVKISKRHKPQQHSRSKFIKKSVEAAKTKMTQTKTPLSQSLCEELSPRESPQKMINGNQNVDVPKVPEACMMDTKNTSATGNILSYVQVNVPQPLVPKKRHVKISTDEKRELEEEEVVSASSVNIKKEPNDLELVRTSATISSLNKKLLKCKEVKKRPADEVQDMPTSSTKVMISSQSTPLKKATYILQCESQEDKVQVMILNVSKSKKATLIECSTVQGVIPPRIIRLYYPPNCKLPSGLTHLYIPRILVHPDVVNSIKKIKVSHSNDKYPIVKFEKNSGSLSFTPSHHSRIKTESEDIEYEEIGLDDFENESSIPSDGNDGLDGESRRGEVIKLLEQYSQQCRQEKTRLLNTLQESHQQQISLLRQVLTVFQQLQHVC